MTKAFKKCTSAPSFVSSKQLVIPEFETPFSRKLSSTNRWFILAQKIPWDEICNVYTKQVGISHTGRPLYMQYFLGYSSFVPEPPFDASLFVEFRSRMCLEQINAINEKISHLHQSLYCPHYLRQLLRRRLLIIRVPFQRMGDTLTQESSEPVAFEGKREGAGETDAVARKGRVLLDATACPKIHLEHR
jgi:hypothetical protein